MTALSHTLHGFLVSGQVHWAVSITVILLFFMAYGIVFGLFRARGSDSQLVSMSDGNMLLGEVTFGVRVLGFQYGVSANLQFSPLSFPPGFTTPDGRLAVDSLGVQINGVKYSYANGTVCRSPTQHTRTPLASNRGDPFSRSHSCIARNDSLALGTGNHHSEHWVHFGRLPRVRKPSRSNRTRIESTA